ncbi:hypothetical protein PIB30_028718 [Stylosanthes scabra]|uniref:Uncharacterized protein n=1 Tax=Stylosanthes scabra TaxID=79078 RepID=A0ABU6VCD6_9FABA|nr:hypothetical protein [Stylosanthes scabra]
MAKKKSCQNVRVPRVLSVADRELYGWVDREIFTQPSVVEANTLPELRREIRLTVDRAAEGDYVLEAASPSDLLPFRAQEDRTHYLWVYTELFTRLVVQLPFTAFQREVLSRCRVTASQLHFNGWGFPRTFERVLPLPGKRPFWLDDEGAPFPWVYWNAEVGDFRVTALDPLETLAFEFLQSLPASLGKKSNFKCRWILDHNDADVGAFLDSLLKDMEKQSRFDRLMQKMKEAEGAGPRSILPSSKAQTTASGASAFSPATPASIPATSVPPAPSSGASKAAGKSTNATVAKLFSVEREKGVSEDPAVDLRQKRRKRKVSEAFAEEAALEGDSAWKHKVNPIDRAFPPDYNFRDALDAGLTNGPTREILGPLVPEQLLGTAQFLACQLTACLQVQLEKELAAAKEQVDVLTAEMDSALAAPLLHAKIKSLTEELERAEGECLSATEHMKEVERKAKVQAAELESCRSALAQERKKVESLSQFLKGKQTTLYEAEAAATHWRDEWRSLGEETGEMVQETFEILMDQAKRIYNPKAEAQGQPEPVVEQPEPMAEEQRTEEVVAGEGGGCPT